MLMELRLQLHDLWKHIQGTTKQLLHKLSMNAM